MKTDNDLLMVCEWMEPVVKFGITKTVSEKGWWRSNCKVNGVTATSKTHLVPNKDPRTSIEAAMEVLKIFDNYCIEKRNGVFHVKILHGKANISYQAMLDKTCRIAVRLEAIFNATVKLIKYLKELDENKMWTGEEGDNEPA